MEKKQHALRKLLEAVEHELLRKPNAKTLDRLSLLVGFQDWETFQETLNGETSGGVNFEIDKDKKSASPEDIEKTEGKEEDKKEDTQS